MGTCIAVLWAPGCATRAKRDTDQSEMRYQLAVGNFRNQRIEAALEEIDKAIAADPENAEPHNLLGLIALKQAYDYGAQAEGFSCLKGSDATSVRAEEQKKLQEALGHFRKAVALRSDYPEAWNNISVVALLMQDWEQAIEGAQNALKEPTYTSPMFARANLGWAYFQKKELQKAWKELYDSVSQSPGFCVGRYRLAKVYVERGDVDQAIETLDPLLADSKRCPIQEAYLLGGLLHEKRNDTERARELFRSCVDMASRSCTAEECRRYAQMIQ